MSAPGFDFKVLMVLPDGSQTNRVVVGAAGWTQAMEWAEAVVPAALAVGAVCLSRPGVADDQKGGVR